MLRFERTLIPRGRDKAGAIRGAVSLLVTRSPVSRDEFASERFEASRAQWDQSLLQARIDRRFQELLNFASDNVTFYRDALSGQPQAVEDVPILSRVLLRTRSVDLLSPGARTAAPSYTSGTSGAAAVVLKSWWAKRMGLSAMWRLFAEFGSPPIPSLLDLSSRPARLHGNSLRHDWGLRWRHIGLSDFVSRYQARRTIASDFLLASPAILDALIESLVPVAKLTGCAVSVLERLDRAARERLIADLNTPLGELYTASELTAPIAFACRLGTLHANQDYVYVEILDPSCSPVGVGEVGHVVVTDLMNGAMPLLRYALGDLARRLPACKCGRVLPALRVEGRGISIRSIADRDPFRLLNERLSSAAGEFVIIRLGPQSATVIASRPAVTASVASGESRIQISEVIDPEDSKDWRIGETVVDRVMRPENLPAQRSFDLSGLS